MRREPTDLLANLVETHALTAAATSGLLDSLMRGSTSTRRLAARHDLALQAVSRLLDVLAAAGLVEHTDEGWTAADILHDFERRMPRDLASVASAFSMLPRYLRDGRSVSGSAGETDYASSVGTLEWIFSDAAKELASKLDLEVGGTVLDLGTGSGVFGLAIARAHRATRLIGVDQPRVARVFAARSAAAGLEATVEVIAGDFLTAELPSGCDCTLICNVLRVIEPDDAAALIRRAVATLSKRGRLVIVDVMGSDPQDEARLRAAYRLDLALRSDAGGPHDDEEVAGWIDDAGGEIVRRFRLACGPLGEEALVVRRSASSVTQDSGV